MPVSFERIAIGAEYDRPTLAALWGYQSFHAIGRGVITPAGQDVIVLFITRNQQPALPQYDNYFNGELLWMDGENGHGSDQRLANSPGNDHVHLFYRERDHTDFRYCGEVTLVEAFLRTDDQPSRFVFTARPASIAEADQKVDDFEPQPEGRAILRLHVVYERNRENRDRAIELHGRHCNVCGFDFDGKYGADFEGATSKCTIGGRLPRSGARRSIRRPI